MCAQTNPPSNTIQQSVTNPLNREIKPERQLNIHNLTLSINWNESNTVEVYTNLDI